MRALGWCGRRHGRNANPQADGLIVSRSQWSVCRMGREQLRVQTSILAVGRTACSPSMTWQREDEHAWVSLSSTISMHALTMRGSTKETAHG
jgi:hypothetical protein